MDVFLISLRETIEFSLILLLLAGVYRGHNKTLISSSLLVIVAGILVTVFNYPLSGSLEGMYVNFMSFSFLMILFLSFVSGREPVWPVICMIFAILAPSAQLASVIIGEAYLKGSVIYLYSSAGFIVGAFIFLYALRQLPKLELDRLFSFGSIMVFIASFCFLFGGLNEFDMASVITTLHRKLHVPLSYFVELVRSGYEGDMTPALESTFIYLASERVAMAVTALILFIPPLYVFIRLLVTPEPSTESIEVKAERRKILAVYTDELIKKGMPLLVALLVIIVLLHSANLAMSPMYDPEPIPLVADEEMITIPLKGKYGDISDGRIRKFSLRQQGRAYRFIVISKAEGEVTAVLDACEICPDHGYVQRGEHVICKYCSTPIPLISLGQVGGCNPIPLRSEKEGDSLLIKKSEIVKTHDNWLGEGVEHGR
jgi:hypothetical protein